MHNIRMIVSTPIIHSQSVFLEQAYNCVQKFQCDKMKLKCTWSGYLPQNVNVRACADIQ